MSSILMCVVSFQVRKVKRERAMDTGTVRTGRLGERCCSLLVAAFLGVVDAVKTRVPVLQARRARRHDTMKLPCRRVLVR
jgi:hypothetical protein